MKIRKTVAAAVLAGAAVFSVAACSDSDDNSAASSSANSVATSAAVSTADQSSAAAPADLDAAKTQVILRTAIDPATADNDIDTVVDTTNPATKAMLQAYAKGAADAGYGPEVYRVKSVAADGTDKAVATVAVTSPHAPGSPVDLPLSFVKVGGTWKLSGEAVSELSEIMGSHGG